MRRQLLWLNYVQCVYMQYNMYEYRYVCIVTMALTNRLWLTLVSNIIDTLLVCMLNWYVCVCLCNLDILLQILPHRSMLQSHWVIMHFKAEYIKDCSL